MTATEYIRQLLGREWFTVETTPDSLHDAFKRVVLDTTTPGIARSAALAYLDEVNWKQLARQINASLGDDHAN
jgi:hypothetical protein